MNLFDLREMCLAMDGVTEDQPFGPDVLAFRVAGKIFALTRPEEWPPRVNLKCDPERAVVLRDSYSGIVPGYHMNKKHWNTVALQEDVPDALIRELVIHSYQLVRPSH